MPGSVGEGRETGRKDLTEEATYRKPISTLMLFKKALKGDFRRAHTSTVFPLQFKIFY